MWEATNPNLHSSGRTPVNGASARDLSYPSRNRGFSLVEMMVVMAVITIIMASVFKSINLTQQTSRNQQIKLDLTQQARQFVDQLTIDLRNAGYPNQRNMTNVSDPNTAGSPAFISPADTYNAPGLIYVDTGQLWFAGDLDGTTSALYPGSANVRIVRYDYYAVGTNCPCLRRTEFARSGGDPVLDAQNPGTAVAQLEIQGVQNAAIFTVYDDTGTALTLPLDIKANAV